MLKKFLRWFNGAPRTPQSFRDLGNLIENARIDIERYRAYVHPLVNTALNPTDNAVLGKQGEIERDLDIVAARLYNLSQFTATLANWTTNPPPGPKVSEPFDLRPATIDFETSKDIEMFEKAEAMRREQK